MKMFDRLKIQGNKAHRRSPEFRERQRLRRELIRHGEETGGRYSERYLLRLSALTGISYHQIVETLREVDPKGAG